LEFTDGGSNAITGEFVSKGLLEKGRVAREVAVSVFG
jgi:hypothetical protein